MYAVTRLENFRFSGQYLFTTHEKADEFVMQMNLLEIKNKEPGSYHYFCNTCCDDLKVY